MAFYLIRKSSGGGNVPCYLHPGMFRKRALPLPGCDLLPIREIPSADELAARDVAVISTTEPQTLLEDMFGYLLRKFACLSTS
jgi:7,8-dihydropterin-6-yl-methyl-4-(beta-D-ribofuranosyl)aminobenzene 5'-phosphate synthase